jgi:hypothetical protein
MMCRIYKTTVEKMPAIFLQIEPPPVEANCEVGHYDREVSKAL